MKYKYLLILLLTCSIINIASSATITGQIIDENSNPIIGATVYIELKEGSVGTNTDANGQFILLDIPVGEHTINVRFIGYKNVNSIINITTESKYTEDFILLQSAIEAEDTEIIGRISRKDKITDAPASMETITSERIEIESTANLGSYLKGLKGVDYTASGIDSYAISVRGFNSSFSSRLLTLTDGRVANIPALRVVAYNTIPQSQDDIEKMEVVLGPATALYGANAHSGVVNIVSKAPATSEGFSLHVSGSQDDREVRKINGRFAKKFNDHISFKISGSYLHAYEWEFISENEWKSHQYAWVGAPGRRFDTFDNGPWDTSIPTTGADLDWLMSVGQKVNDCDTDGDGICSGNGDDPNGWDINNHYWYGETNDGRIVMIGDGEANHGDMDGDGIAGEDWVNGYDDDGDGSIDEDYFWSDGIDNDGDGEIDEYIDDAYETMLDGYDNNGNGTIDEDAEFDGDGDGIFDWGQEVDDNTHNILINNGRVEEYIDGQENDFYIDEGTDPHIRGASMWDEDNFTLIFDTYDKDYGQDGLAGDLHIDSQGNGEYDSGEMPGTDCGMDGICPLITEWGNPDLGQPNPDYPGPDLDGTELNGEWEPGDAWLDDNGNGVVDMNDGYDFNVNSGNYPDVWPPPNGIYDEGELIINDFGQDGLEGTGDPGEGDGILRGMDYGELDGAYDTGDGCYGCSGDLTSDRFQRINDTNGDLIDDFPDFEVDNRKAEARIDVDGIPFFGLDELNLTYQTGYSWSKSQIVTGVGRYLVDGWEYTFHQFKANYKNWFFQTYINDSYSGDTRGYLRGDLITDYSQNIAVQIQNNFSIEKLSTQIIWGYDFFRTLPETKGSILNDGPNGLDEDGDGITDEEDEFDNPQADEMGIYYQSITPFSDKWELITAARLDHHDQLSDEGLQFGPKMGLTYNPNPSNSWRITFGRAFNTPTTTSLFTNYFVQRYRIFNVYLRGNKDGTNYARVSEDTDVVVPSYYNNQGDLVHYGEYNWTDPYGGDNYLERIQDMPYFYLYGGMNGVPADWIPLDTTNFLVYIPEPNGDGFIIDPADVNTNERYIPDIPAIKSEKINSLELGYKGYKGNVMFSIDYYINHYSDFFSPAMYLTPTVIHRYNDDGSQATIDNFEFAGFIPPNQHGSNPPYGTAWNGIDDDGDWEIWADEFGWDQDDKNGDGDPRDPGEWGFVDRETGTVYTPAQLGFNGIGLPEIYTDDDLTNDPYGINANILDRVGIDEWSPTSGLSEFECDNYPCNQNEQAGRPTSPPEIILGVLNYGNIWQQGVDVAFTQVFSEKMFLSGNFSWFNSTEFYNELTRQKDPINAPKFKWNISFNWDSPYGMLSTNYRHVDEFKWQDGIWAGSIGPYNIIDLHYKYNFNKFLSSTLSIINLFNDEHEEIIGGAKMGRQFILRFSSKF